MTGRPNITGSLILNRFGTEAIGLRALTEHFYRRTTRQSLTQGLLHHRQYKQTYRKIEKSKSAAIPVHSEKPADSHLYSPKDWSRH